MVLRGLLLLSIERFDDSCVSYVRIALVRSIVFSDRGIRCSDLTCLRVSFVIPMERALTRVGFFMGVVLKLELGIERGS